MLTPSVRGHPSLAHRPWIHDTEGFVPKGGALPDVPTESMAEPQSSPKSSDSTDPLIGRVINDRFEVLGLIARGGMGRVYRAKQIPLGRLVALKVLDPRQAQDAEGESFQTRFFLEAATSAKLSHPNTVTVFDYGRTEDGVFYIAMELVEGRTLAKVLSEQAPFEAKRAVHIASQIARSLREAHQLGVVHRDLKPANVLITRHGDEDDFAKVLDFGLVKNVADDVEMTQAGTFMGSPKYMSPEQIQGTEIDGRSDIYALGCILYYMLTGRVPFDRENQVQILMAHCREAPPPMVRADGEAIPQPLQHLTLRCLAKEREQRFLDMNELLAALRASGAGAGASGSHSLTDLDPSGTRSLATTSGGSIDVTFSTTMSSSSGPNAGLHSSEHSGRYGAGRRNGLVAALLTIAVLIGGGAAYVSVQQKKRAEADRAAAAELAHRREVQAANAARVEAERLAAVAAARPAPVARVQILLTSTPSGAEIFADDRSIGQTPLDIEWTGDEAAPGRQVTFRFERTGFRPFTASRTLTGERIEVAATLEAIPVARAPTGMATRVDGPIRMPDGYRDSPF